MNISVVRNSFVEPTQSRQQFVQNFCDYIVKELNKRVCVDICVQGQFPKLFFSENSNEVDLYGVADKKIRSCEVRLAFRMLQNAGYHIFYKEEDKKYYITKREYMGNRKAVYTDFLHHID